MSQLFRKLRLGDRWSSVWSSRPDTVMYTLPKKRKKKKKEKKKEKR